jgi:hypothetical protein
MDFEDNGGIRFESPEHVDQTTKFIQHVMNEPSRVTKTAKVMMARGHEVEVNQPPEEVTFAEGPELETWRKEQRLNEKWLPIINFLENPDEFEGTKTELKKLKLVSRYYVLRDGLLHMKKDMLKH